LKHILGGDRFEDILLGRLLNFSANEQLVENEIGFLEVEDNVEFTYLKMKDEC
jgi:hypothetical protein